jgi:hypothetical protein
MSKPDLKVVSGETPDPPYPPDTTANGWHPEFHLGRIVASDTWTLAEDDERPWLLRIWMESWFSVPVGSMPAERRLFSRRIGCKVAFLDAHAEILMRGWELHSDGLLYHSFIVGQVLAMIAKRTKSREKVSEWRKKRRDQDGDVTSYKDGCNGNIELRNGNNGTCNRQEQETGTGTGTGSRAESRGSSTRERSDNGSCFSFDSLPDDWRQKAQTIRPDLNPDAVFREFSEHWTTGEGAGARRVHWSAVWTKWVGREKGTPANTVNGNNGGWKNGRESDHDRIKRTNDELIARARAAASLG